MITRGILTLPYDDETLLMVGLINELRLSQRRMILTFQSGSYVYPPGGAASYATYQVHEFLGQEVYMATVAACQGDTNPNAWQVAHEYRHHLQYCERGGFVGDDQEEREACQFADMLLSVLRSPMAQRLVPTIVQGNGIDWWDVALRHIENQSPCPEFRARGTCYHQLCGLYSATATELKRRKFGHSASQVFTWLQCNDSRQQGDCLHPACQQSREIMRHLAHRKEIRPMPPSIPRP